MKDPDLIQWANNSKSQYVRGFAFRLIAKRFYKKGMYKSAVDYATKAMSEYPANCSLFTEAQQDFIKYQFSLLIFDKEMKSENFQLLHHEKFEELIVEMED